MFDSLRNWYYTTFTHQKYQIDQIINLLTYNNELLTLMHQEVLRVRQQKLLSIRPPAHTETIFDREAARVEKFLNSKEERFLCPTEPSGSTPIIPESKPSQTPLPSQSKGNAVPSPSLTVARSKSKPYRDTRSRRYSSKARRTV